MLSPGNESVGIRQDQAANRPTAKAQGVELGDSILLLHLLHDLSSKAFRTRPRMSIHSGSPGGPFNGLGKARPSS